MVLESLDFELADSLTVIFELSKTEYLAYEKMLPHLPTSIKVPKMVGGDFNFTSHKVCMILLSLFKN